MTWGDLRAATFLWIASCASGSALAAEQGRIDLPIGAVFPSNNAAAELNPAALGALGGKILEFAGYSSFQGDYAVSGSYARSGGGLGFGLGFLKLTQDVSISGGVGFAVKKVTLGVNAETSLTRLSPGFGLGFRYAGSSKFGVGLVFSNIGNIPRNYTLGFGLEAAKWLRFNLDLSVSHSSGFGVDAADAALGALLTPTADLSLAASAGASVVPQFSLGRVLTFGACYWVTKRIALFAYLGHALGRYAGGIKVGF